MFYKRGEVICDQFEHLKIFSFGESKRKERPQKQKKRDYVGKILKEGGGGSLIPTTF